MNQIKVNDSIDNESIDEVFQYSNKFYHIERDKYENRETYLERVWFILKHINDDNTNLDDLIKSSRFYSIQKLYGCEY